MNDARVLRRLFAIPLVLIGLGRAVVKTEGGGRLSARLFHFARRLPRSSRPALSKSPLPPTRERNKHLFM